VAVTPPGSNMMMRSQKISGTAESGRGVCLSGFYAPNGEVQTRLKELDENQGPFCEIDLHESEGWTTFIGATPGDESLNTSRFRVASFRRESHKFFDELSSWFFRIKATHVHRVKISQSSGFISLTMLYSDDAPRV
jgi:hypothetical protein